MMTNKNGAEKRQATAPAGGVTDAWIENYIRSLPEQGRMPKLTPGVASYWLTAEKLRDMLAALITAAEAYPLPDDLYPGSKDWVHSNYAGRVQWLHQMYEAKEEEVQFWMQAMTRTTTAEVEKKYNELLFAVGRKFPAQSRHETALMYIQRAEEAATQSDQAQAGTSNG